MKIWLDDCRPAPEGYLWVKTVSDAIYEIKRHKRDFDVCWQDYILGYCDRETLERRLAIWCIDEISCDNDLGENEIEGYKLLDWLEATGYNFPIHIHTDNPVARERMRAIIERNGWVEVK
jgi:hypothetical protein